MDDTSILKTAGFSTTGMAIVIIVYKLLKTIQGKRLVSSCCGRKMEMSMNVEEMTPKEVVVHNPALGKDKTPPA